MESETLALLVEAFKRTSEALDRNTAQTVANNKLFTRLALWVPVLLVLVMVLLSWVIISATTSHLDANGKHIQQLDDRLLHIKQKQTVIVEKPQTREDTIREEIQHRKRVE